KQEIKQLNKQYYDILKRYYKTNKLILKMIFNNMDSELNLADLNFRTCALRTHSDEHIKKDYEKSVEKAIQHLRTRALSCIYTAYTLEDIVFNNDTPSKEYVNFANEMQVIIDRLYELAEASIIESNNYAKQNNLPLFFEQSHITMKDMREANKRKNWEDQQLY
ncbi:MAG: hypothetical protein ACLRFE_02130, partial [Clostridia bacterium]